MIPPHVKACLGATVLMLWVLVQATWGASPLGVSLYPRNQIAPAGGTVRVRLIVERDADNRLLRWQWESIDYSGASERQLDGAESPRIYTSWLKDLPPGEYHFTAQLARTNGTSILQADTFSIIGVN